jgi:shikimate dehydrogenase
VVLGGGATARSTLAALAALGCTTPVLVVRSSPDRTLEAAERLGVAPEVVPWSPEVLDACQLLVSTLPAGAADSMAPYVADVPVLLDVVYDPWPTALAAGCSGVVVSGAAMLLHQAAEQVRLMTGRAAPLEAMRQALELRHGAGTGRAGRLRPPR